MKTTDIYLVCGYYGVGKTSYINELIQTLHGKIYIMQNEIGEIALDADGIHSDTVIGGCVCCSLMGELIMGLSRYAEEGADHIIVELSSIAELSKAQQFCLFLAEKRGFSFDIHSITVVDSRKFKSHLKNFGGFYSNQIKNADVLVLTRESSLSPEAKASLHATIRKMAPQAAVENKNNFIEE